MNRRSAPQNRGGILTPETPKRRMQNAECVSGWGSRQVRRGIDTILIGRLGVIHMPFAMRNMKFRVCTVWLRVILVARRRVDGTIAGACKEGH